ncbi:Lrp/AsnC family transcriptional regulator [Chloroflexales bacterium ZM16-3]|nr:Lrp/AsnC family transcriptional regulator [Chloroflexales bacterium ZM16-3]
MNNLNSIDIQILDLLQNDGRMTHVELAQQVGLTPPTVQRRVRLLEERGYIRGYAALLDPIALGLTTTAYVFIESRSGGNLEELEAFLSDLPGVQELNRMIGEWCFLLKVRTASPQSLERLIYQDLRRHPDVRRTQSTLATSSAFETTRLPLPEPDGVAGEEDYIRRQL